MKLHPNPPRLVTVGLAVALAVIGFIYAWPVDPLLSVLAPVTDALSGFGIRPGPELGYLGLFASGCLMVAGSLLPGI